MKNTKRTALSSPDLDPVRFELFLNVFVRTPDRNFRRGGARKRVSRRDAVLAQ